MVAGLFTKGISAQTVASKIVRSLFGSNSATQVLGEKETAGRRGTGLGRARMIDGVNGLIQESCLIYVGTKLFSRNAIRAVTARLCLFTLPFLLAQEIRADGRERVASEELPAKVIEELTLHFSGVHVVEAWRERSECKEVWKVVFTSKQGPREERWFAYFRSEDGWMVLAGAAPTDAEMRQSAISDALSGLLTLFLPCVIGVWAAHFLVHRITGRRVDTFPDWLGVWIGGTAIVWALFSLCLALFASKNARTTATVLEFALLAGIGVSIVIGIRLAVRAFWRRSGLGHGLLGIAVLAVASAVLFALCVAHNVGVAKARVEYYDRVALDCP
jgi:hypothetical protein